MNPLQFRRGFFLKKISGKKMTLSEVFIEYEKNYKIN